MSRGHPTSKFIEREVLGLLSCFQEFEIVSGYFRHSVRQAYLAVLRSTVSLRYSRCINKFTSLKATALAMSDKGSISSNWYFVFLTPLQSQHSNDLYLRRLYKYGTDLYFRRHHYATCVYFNRLHYSTCLYFRRLHYATGVYFRRLYISSTPLTYTIAAEIKCDLL